jgi:cyclin D2
VFPLSVAYLNRVLSTQPIPAGNLQALASACLFIASKMKAPNPITAKRLSQYSDGSVSVDMILVSKSFKNEFYSFQSWEIVVVNILQWDICLQTVFEFFDQLLVRAPALETLRDSFCTVAYNIQKGTFIQNSTTVVVGSFSRKNFL